MQMKQEELVLILDFGSQYTQLITRRIRELGVYSEIRPFDLPVEEMKSLKPRGIILSGGPSSVYDASAPLPDRRIFELHVPVLGICYGLQAIVHLLGGKVVPTQKREYGYARLIIDDFSDLFKGLPAKTQVWMSHADMVKTLPPGFKSLAHTDNSPYAAIGDQARKIYGLQFHPEVAHTVEGTAILRNFLFEICHCEGRWTPASFVKSSIASIRQQVGKGRALCALSGGVDSAVAATLVYKAINGNLTCIFVDTGLMRKNEAQEVEKNFRPIFKSNLIFVEASDLFLQRLKGVIHPEEKRRIIGNTFIEVFEAEAKKLAGVEYLVQGTLYPDVIESTSVRGPSDTIKTHHNVGGLPEVMNLKLVEPLRELFKDEVRLVGKQLGLSEEILNRHPFPGPGLAVRIIGEVTRQRVKILQEVDAIFMEELKQSGWYDKIWQAFAVLLPIKTVGVMGDQRTYENVVALRAVTSKDGMTADWARIPYDLLARISNRIINEVTGVNRVVYDVSSKPPSTIEWE
ncbi:MAG: glutamine-hydrolyzing GMP synthase [Calditrichaeota bacterium]|nr:MAG: glutamine-hydrolyzing GMP synthase [Calditrichota bacterium]